MPSNPVLQRVSADIVTAGGDEWFMNEIASGTTIAVLAALLECSTGLLYRWVHVTEERELAFLEARAISAHQLVDEAMGLVDNADDLSPNGVAKAKLQAGIRQWLAARRNRKQYGEEKASLTPVVQIGQLFLEAARERASERQLPAATEHVVEADVVKAEVVPDDDPTT